MRAINGGPTVDDLNNLKDFDVVFSHSIGQPDTDLNAYKLVTASAARASKTSEVPALVDNAIATAIKKKRPVYVEISMDLWSQACPRPTQPLSLVNPADGTEKQLATTIVGLIRAAAAPLILIGTEIQRYGLADQVADLIAKLGVRWSTALLAKSTLAEQGNGWVGVYDPPHSIPAVARAVERAGPARDARLRLPERLQGAGDAPWRPHRVGDDGKVKIKGGAKQHVEIGALVTALVTEAQRRRRTGTRRCDAGHGRPGCCGCLDLSPVARAGGHWSSVAMAVST